MDILKGLNLGVRFLLELCMLAAVGYWGFKTQSGWMLKIVLGIGLPVLIAVIWGLFVAPQAMYPLGSLPHLVLELILLPVRWYCSPVVNQAWAGSIRPLLWLAKF